MMIDAHNHPYWFGMTADKMVADMDAEGIDKTWRVLLQNAPPKPNEGAGLQYPRPHQERRNKKCIVV